MLQNCHLAESWMKDLEKIYEDICISYKDVHRDFRLILTSFPSTKFPLAIL